MDVAGFDEDLDHVLAAMSPGSLAMSYYAPPAVVVDVAAGSIEDDDDDGVAGACAADLRRGPWTVDEDILLVNYIATHGEGRWNSLARSAGLKRTGKSCRLRWLNYLRPDVRRGNITADEQLLILELHSRWGNRWSKIAAHLPGRTDNEIKNYWRTRVQKHAKQLGCDVNSAGFRHVVRHVWMPRLRERALADRDDQLAAGAGCRGKAPAASLQVVVQAVPATTTASAPAACYNYYGSQSQQLLQQHGVPAASEADHHHRQYYSEPAGQMAAAATALSPDDASSAVMPSSSLTTDDASHFATADGYTSAATATATDNQSCGPTTTDDDDVFAGSTWSELLATAGGGPDDSMSMIGLSDFVGFGDLESGLCTLDDLCLQQLC